MKNFKNNLSRNEMRTIFAGHGGGGGPVPIGGDTPECGEDCSGQPSGFCNGGCNKCEGGKCSGL